MKQGGREVRGDGHRREEVLRKRSCIETIWKGEKKRRGRERVCMETMAGDQTQASGLMIFDICREKNRRGLDMTRLIVQEWDGITLSAQVRGERVF